MTTIDTGAGEARDAINKAARALSDRVADMCNVDREDHWKYHFDEVQSDAELVISTYLAATPQAAPTSSPRRFAGWLVSDDEGNDDFVNNLSALAGRHYKGGHPLLLEVCAAPSQPVEQVPSEWDAMRDALESIREHCRVQPSALAAAIVATCDSALAAQPPVAAPQGERCTYPSCSGEEPEQGECCHTAKGEVLGEPYPDWPSWCTTFRERAAYQAGVYDARKVATPPQPVEEREAFESWAVEQPRVIQHEDCFAKSPYGKLNYEWGDVQSLWLAWQARAALEKKGGTS